jgi:phage tail sheath gpL-like
MAISTAVDVSAVARVTGIKTEFVDFRGNRVVLLPQQIAVIGQGSTSATYSTDKMQHTSATSVGSTYGFGSPLHLAALQLMPTNGDGVGTIPVHFYPLEDDGSGVASAGDVTPSGTATESASYLVSVNNTHSEEFVISVGDDVATMVTAMTDAINANINMPVIATDSTTQVDLVAKWAGESGNDIHVEVVGPTTAGITFAVTQPTGGLVDPDVQPALDQFGDVWETMVLNCFPPQSGANLDAIQTFGEGRWGSLVKKPFVSFLGDTSAAVSVATTVPELRKTDRINSQLVAPGSKNLPLEVAARQLARIAVLANNNPPHDYGGQDATGLVPGDDGVQWLYPDRDQAIKKGCSTVEVKDGVVNLADIVTMHHPTGNPLPEYRHVVDIVKLQNIIFNIDLRFSSAEWDGAPLIPDDQPTSNRTAKKPRMAVAEAAAIVDGLGLEAIISDPETAKANIVAGINTQNPKRLDLCIPVQVSGNVNIKSIDLKWGFYFGEQQIVA